MAKILTCYLAGPIANCNEAQRTQWRKQLSKHLQKIDWRCVDPTSHDEKKWSPFTEMMEIQRCDALVANMWTKSIGTVVGIMQARRMGKPVILVDSSQIESRILKEIVGPENVIQDLREVPNHLQKARARLERLVEVRKLNGDMEPFDLRKLTRSITATFGRVHSLNDDWLPTAVAMQVHEELVTSADAPVETATIKRMILASLERFADPTNKTLTESLRQLAIDAKVQWESAEEEKMKADIASECIDDKNAEIDDLKAQIAFLGKLNDKREGKDSEVLDQIYAQAPPAFSCVNDAVYAAREHFHEYLIFADGLDDSIATCSYENPTSIYECLQSLAQYAYEQQRMETMDLREWWKLNARRQYAPTESQGVLNDARRMEQRSATYQGIKLKLREHIKLGIGGKCCRIYMMNMTSGVGKVLIGAISRHPD